ncbi:MAG: alpha/beta fold hydrolase [Microbacteriaceae bacterium]
MAEREKTFRGTTYFTSRSTTQGLGIVLRRFPERDASVSGRNYVLVHGIGVSSRYFQPLAVELARTGTVWTIDLPGYGAAPNPHRDVSITDHAHVLWQMLRDSAIDNPVLVGHSMGCQVVTELVRLHPDAVSGLVLLAPTINPAERSLRQQAWNMTIDTLREPPRANWVVLTDYFIRCGVPYYLRQLTHLLGDAIEERLPLIDTTTVVIVGDRDEVVPRDWAREVATLLPHATLAVVKGPHVIMYTDPESIAACIRDVFEP